MNLIEYIGKIEDEANKLREIYEEHGNLEVLTPDPYGSGVREPFCFNSEIAYLKIPTKRERVRKFYSEWKKNENEKGEKVLKV